MMKPPLVELKHVDVDLGGRRVLRDLTWRLRPGQHWVILGGNGSGKSSFLRLVRGELWPVPGQAARRGYCLDGKPRSTAVGIKESFAFVSPELQSRYLQLEWSPRVRDVICSGVRGGDYVYQSLAPAERERVAMLTDLMRVRQLATRNVQELSTGELRRVLIARALAGRPRVLVCDEIGDGLDAESRGTLLTALDAAARQGTQLLVATHRGDEIPDATTHQLVLELGRIKVQERLGQGRGRAEIDPCVSVLSEAIAPIQVGGARRSRRFPSPARSGSGQEVSGAARANVVGSGPKSEIWAPGANGVGVIPAPGGSERFGAPLIQIRHADVYLGSGPALRNIDLEIRQGQHWAVLGPNGSGKSTLLKLIAGDVHPALGAQVRRFAFTRRDTIWQVRACVGVVSPELQAAYRENISGADVVASGFFSSVGLLDRPSKAQSRRVRRILAALGLSALAGRPFPELSYGEARRILLARALVKEPAMLLFDEPYDGLDAAARQLMSEALEQAAATGTTLVVVTHHDEDLPRCITHVARMKKGRCHTAERGEPRPSVQGADFSPLQATNLPAASKLASRSSQAR